MSSFIKGENRMVETLSKEVTDMKSSIKFKKKSQITIPIDMVEILGLKEGDTLDIILEDGKLVLIPTISIPKEQSWYWKEKWQMGEKEADIDIAQGRVKTFNNLDDLFDDLDNGE